MNFAVYVNPWRRPSGDLQDSYARVHTTRCGEWTEGRHEYPGGFWWGPYERFMEAIVEAESTGYQVVTCNLSKILANGIEVDREPGPKAETLYYLSLKPHQLREVYVHPRVDVFLEKDVYGDSLVLHSYEP